jgi:hypothetical protein
MQRFGGRGAKFTNRLKERTHLKLQASRESASFEESVMQSEKLAEALGG